MEEILTPTRREKNALYQSPVFQRLTGPVLRPGGLGLTEESAQICGLRSGERLLDVGCGYGEAAAMLQNRFGVNAYGMDLDFGLLNGGVDLTHRSASQRRLPQDPEQVADTIMKIQAGAERIPFRSGYFQVVLCECVLSLTTSMKETLNEFKRVLSSGGRLILCDIYLRNPQAAETYPLNEIPMACGFRKAVSQEKIQALLEEVGFVYEWQDLSPVLTQFAGQAIFEHGSLQQFWAALFGGCHSKHAEKTCEMVRASRPGYYRIVAHKSY